VPAGAVRGELDTRHKSENEAFSKREFIALYIGEHSKGRPEKPGLVAPPDTGRHSVSWRSPDPEAFLSGIEAELLDGKVYADSYIAQRLKRRVRRVLRVTRSSSAWIRTRLGCSLTSGIP
jgi:hypothetical protein